MFLAFHQSVLGTPPERFLWQAWADGGLKQPDMMDYHDQYARAPRPVCPIPTSRTSPSGAWPGWTTPAGQPLAFSRPGWNPVCVATMSRHPFARSSQSRPWQDACRPLIGSGSVCRAANWRSRCTAGGIRNSASGVVAPLHCVSHRFSYRLRRAWRVARPLGPWFSSPFRIGAGESLFRREWSPFRLPLGRWTSCAPRRTVRRRNAPGTPTCVGGSATMCV